MHRTLQLAAIGTAAGLISGLLGVGGGVVAVPLMILWLGFGEREATGTSLVMIVISAAGGAALHAGYGNVRLEEAALIGVPALAGVLVGTALQQRVPQQRLSLLFAVLLLAAGTVMVAP